jgi:curved DNA-binding protein CbpA
MDLYAVLDVPRNADAAAIRRAFKRKAKTAHPDRGGSACAFHHLTLARDVLCHPQARAYFDRTGEVRPPKPENAADAVHGLAVQSLIDLLAALPDPLSQDVLRAMELRAAADILAAERAIAELERVLSVLPHVIGRLRHRRDGENVLARLAEGRLRGLAEELTRRKAAAEQYRLLQMFLEDYTFSNADPQSANGVNADLETAEP